MFKVQEEGEEPQLGKSLLLVHLFPFHPELLSRVAHELCPYIKIIWNSILYQKSNVDRQICITFVHVLTYFVKINGTNPMTNCSNFKNLLKMTLQNGRLDVLFVRKCRSTFRETREMCTNIRFSKTTLRVDVMMIFCIFLILNRLVKFFG